MASLELRLLLDLERHRHVARIALAPLSRGETATLVQAVARVGAAAAVDDLAERVWTASAGNPFMAVETIHALEQGMAADVSGALPLPERVRQVVSARLARLSERGRQLLSVAAVIGRSVEFVLLQRASGLDEAEAAESVEELVRRRVLRVVDERLEFTHERIREVAEGALLPPRRRLLHRRTAEALETIHADAHAAVIGAHYHAGGVWDRAAAALARAGAQALARSANREGAACFEQALDALNHLPPSEATSRDAIDVRLQLWMSLRWSASSTAAWGSSRRPSGPPRLSATGHVSAACAPSSPTTTGGRRGRRRRAGSPSARGRSPRRRRTSRSPSRPVSTSRHGYTTAGDFENARATAEPLVEMLRARPPSREVSAALAVCHTLLAGVLGTIGRTDAALEHAAEAVRIAEALDQRVDLLTALWATGEVHAFARQWPDAIAALERARALCHDWEVTFLRPNIVGTLGYAYALSGRAEEGRRLLESALAEQEQRGWRFAHTLLMTRLGEAHLAAGDPGAAREWGERAVALARRQEERGYEALADQLLAEIKGITWRE